MFKSVYIVKKMDCPTEKSMIEIKLNPIETIRRLDFDLKNRRLTVFHAERDEKIGNALNELKLDSQLHETVEIPDDDTEYSDDTRKQTRLLITVLAINLTFFFIEVLAGIFSNSMGLIADSLDMLSDSTVYAISLFAVGGSILLKMKVAKLMGYFQIILAVLGFSEVIRRFLGFGEMPDFLTMIVVSGLAFMANMYCLYLFVKSESRDVHIKASWICTSNDLYVNGGVILSGILVWFFNSNKPDLIIGGIVFIVVIQGAIKILKLASFKP